jgi:hypothetical protein
MEFVRASQVRRPIAVPITGVSSSVAADGGTEYHAMDAMRTGRDFDQNR